MKYWRKSVTWAAMVLTVLLLLTAHSASAAIFRYDGPYKGRVVDLDTGEPIQGAVILGVWYRIHSHVAGWSSEFYDAVETLTDKNGEFYIRGLGPLFISNIDEMKMVIFKAGYEHLGFSSWDSLKEDSILKQKIKWDGHKAIIPLEKWTIEQRRSRFGDYSVHIPSDKKIILESEIDREYKELGTK